MSDAPEPITVTLDKHDLLVVLGYFSKQAYKWGQDGSYAERITDRLREQGILETS
jgi:hypothetical protein